MSLFPFTKDMQAFLLRATASLDNLDNAVRELQLLTKNANEAVTEVRQAVARLKGQS